MVDSFYWSTNYDPTPSLTMSRRSSASTFPAKQTQQTQLDQKTIEPEASGAISSMTAVKDRVDTPSPSGQHSDTSSISISNSAFSRLASRIPSGNNWKFWSPAWLAHRTQLKLQKCLALEKGCYIVVSGVSEAMVDPINDALKHYGIRNQLRLTYEHDLDSMIIKCTTGIPHERTSWSFIDEITEKIRQIPEHHKHSYHHTGTATFSVPGKRSKEGDGGVAPAGTRDSKFDWPSVVVEVGDSESLEDLQDDAAWWLTNSKGRTRMAIIIKFSKDPMSLRLERWEQIDDETVIPTRSRQPKVPGCTGDWVVDAAGNVTHDKDHPDLVIPYRTVFDVDHPHATDLIISKDDLKLWALHIYKGLTDL